MPDDEIIRDMMSKLEDHERRISKLEGIPAEKREAETKKLSIKEFILMKRPRDDVKKTLVIAYYLEHFEGLSTFNVKDLEEGYRYAREPVPANINDKVNMNINKGHMMSAKELKDKLKAWVLTNSGEQLVENAFAKGQ